MNKINSKFQIPNSKFGFTLIELLVVISIIGILSTLLMANVGGVRERARDAQRKSDINQIQKALEMYKNSRKPPVYPAGNTIDALTTPLTGGDFMKKVPHDPKCTYNTVSEAWECGGWPDYGYVLDTTDSLKYTLTFCLENKSDQQKDDPLVACGPDGKGATFSRREP